MTDLSHRIQSHAKIAPSTHGTNPHTATDTAKIKQAIQSTPSPLSARTTDAITHHDGRAPARQVGTDLAGLHALTTTASPAASQSLLSNFSTAEIIKGVIGGAALAARIVIPLVLT